MVVYSLSYQDGLQDALSRIGTMRRTGTFSHTCDVRDQIDDYTRMKQCAVRRRRYWDGSYIEGYINGLIFLLSDNASKWDIPLFYMPGAPAEAPTGTSTQLKRLYSRGKRLHKTAYREAERIAARYDEAIVVHHPATLLGLEE